MKKLIATNNENKTNMCRPKMNCKTLLKEITEHLNKWRDNLLEDQKAQYC